MRRRGGGRGGRLLSRSDFDVDVDVDIEGGLRAREGRTAGWMSYCRDEGTRTEAVGDL